MSEVVQGACPCGSRRRFLLALALVALSAAGCISVRSTRSGSTAQPLADTTLRIYLARHGQTDWNVARRLQGHTDIELNATGREQAALLRTRIQQIPLDQVYSSTLSRSRETAEIVHGTVALTSLPDLREQNVGKFEGQVVDEAHADVLAEFQRRSRLPDDDLDGGESENQFVARVRRALDTIRSERPAGSILIVGHSGTNRAILRVLLNLSADDAGTIQQANDELYLVDLPRGGAPRLWKWIDSAHLTEL
jgi:broad specificity phosphatase PhoE